MTWIPRSPFTRRTWFTVEFRPAPGFARLARGDLRLLLNTPTGPGGAAQPMPDGRVPEPGGWNRIQLEVEGIAGTVERMRADGCRFRSEVITGQGGLQILLDDPSGNPVELFQPVARPPLPGQGEPRSGEVPRAM